MGLSSTAAGRRARHKVIDPSSSDQKNSNDDACEKSLSLNTLLEVAAKTDGSASANYNRRMRNLLRYFLMALLLLVVALVSALTTMRLAIQVREVKVPDLRNKTPAEAKRLAELDGLAAQVDSNYYSAIIPEGRVLSQTPAGAH